MRVRTVNISDVVGLYADDVALRSTPTESQTMSRCGITSIAVALLHVLSPAICIGNATENANYKVVVLLPLSGTESARGRAQRAGIELSVQEHMYKLNLQSHRPVSVEYHDTQCQATSERRTISDYLMRGGDHISILGGNCLPTISPLRAPGSGDFLAGLRLIVPQVTFERFIFADPSGESRLVSTRPTVAQASGAVLRFVRDNGVGEIALAFDRHAAQAVAKFEYANELSESTNISTRVAWRGTSSHLLLRSSRLRVVVLLMTARLAATVICESSRALPGRYTWLVPTLDASALAARLTRHCHPLAAGRVVLFEVPAKLTSKIRNFGRMLQLNTSVNADLSFEAALAYDTANILIDVVISQARLVAIATDQRSFATNVTTMFENVDAFGITGRMQFDSLGMRLAIVDIYQLQHNAVFRIGVYDPKSQRVAWTVPENAMAFRVRREVRSVGVSMVLMVALSALSIVGIIYAVALLVFNVVTHKNKIIKMTSPNINVVIMVGAAIGYSSLLPLGLDSSRCSLEDLSKIMQATTYLVAISFSVVYGAIFAKSLRVYLVFRNLTFNGKLARDEHLLAGVLALALLDLAVLLPWSVVDPVTCSHVTLAETFETRTNTDVTIQRDVCTSRLQVIWVLLLYAIKLAVLAAGTCVARRTRHVTLPSLSDARPTYVVVGALVVIATLALPPLLARDASPSVTSAVGGLAVWLALTVTITLLFLPKVQLYRAHRTPTTTTTTAAARDDDTKFQFSESMRKTQEAEEERTTATSATSTAASTACCRWWLGGGRAAGDKYAQVVLTTEIDSLKRTLKEKESTIRELTDRLYFGCDKMQEYLHTPSKRAGAGVDDTRRHRGNRPDAPQCTLHARTHDSLREYRLGLVDRDRRASADVTAHVPSVSRLVTADEMTSYARGKHVSTSPNDDSAIDNTSPSDDHSTPIHDDMELETVRRPLRVADPRGHDAHTPHIDIVAMESEARPSLVTDASSRRSDADVVMSEPYWTREVDGSTVLQI